MAITDTQTNKPSQIVAYWAATFAAKNDCWEHLILLKSPLFNLLRNWANYRFKKNVHKDGAKMIHHLVDKEIDLHEGEVLLSQNDPYICQTTFCACTSEIKKKFLPITIF